MAKDRNALKAGVFIIVTVVLVLGIIFGIQGIPTAMQTRTVEFRLSDNLGGLRVGDDVRIGGVKVGVVDVIQFEQLPVSRAKAASAPATQTADEGDSGQIVVTFRIPTKYVIRTDSRIGVEGTVTGTSWLNFDRLGAGERLADGVALHGNPSSMSALFATLQKAGPKIDSILENVNDAVEQVKKDTVPVATRTLEKYGRTADSVTNTSDTLRDKAGGLLDDVRHEVKPAADKYHTTMDSASGMMAEVRDVVGDSKLDIRGTMANLNAATGAIKDKLPGIMDRLDAALRDMSVTIATATASLEDVKGLTSSANSIISTKRSKIESMIDSLKKTGDNLKVTSAELRRSPWRLLYKPAKGEMANLNLFDSARQFAEGASDLSDASAALRDALKDKNADPKKIEELVAHLEATFGKFSDVEQTLWNRVKDGE